MKNALLLGAFGLATAGVYADPRLMLVAIFLALTALFLNYKKRT